MRILVRLKSHVIEKKKLQLLFIVVSVSRCKFPVLLTIGVLVKGNTNHVMIVQHFKRVPRV